MIIVTFIVVVVVVVVVVKYKRAMYVRFQNLWVFCSSVSIKKNCKLLFIYLPLTTYPHD